MTGKTILPTFTTRTEAQEEADRLNVINQSVIGTKEGIVEAVSKPVGSDITDAILRTADGSDFKSIDDYTLYEVMKVAIDGADRPTTNDVLEQLLEVINHPFDFR
jgi:predicted transcriptional regulator